MQIQQTGDKDNAGKAKHAIWKMAAESYTGYSGSMEERVEFTFTLLRLESYHIGRRSIRLHGQFTKKTRDAYGSSQKKPCTKTLWLPRTFPIDQEQTLLYFLQNQAAENVS